MIGVSVLTQAGWLTEVNAPPIDQSPRCMPAGHLAKMSMVSPEFRSCLQAEEYMVYPISIW